MDYIKLKKSIIEGYEGVKEVDNGDSRSNWKHEDYTDVEIEEIADQIISEYKRVPIVKFDKESVRIQVERMLMAFGFELVSFETSKPQLDWNNYEVKYNNYSGKEIYWFGRTDSYETNVKSIGHKQGMLNDFYIKLRSNVIELTVCPFCGGIHNESSKFGFGYFCLDCETHFDC